MSAISEVNTAGYGVYVLAAGVQQEHPAAANFADFLAKKEKSVAVGQGPVVSGLISSLAAPTVSAMSGYPVKQEAATDVSDGQSAVNAFRDYMDMTPEERLFISMLAKHGYSKAQYETLPADEKLKLERQIQEDIRTQHEQEIAMGKSVATPADEIVRQGNTQVIGAIHQKRDSLFG